MEQLESRQMLAVSPLLWMEDNNLQIGGGRPDDFILRFEDPETWEHSLRAIDTISLREATFRYVDPVAREAIRNVIAPVLNANQVNVAFNVGDVTWLHRTMAIAQRTAEQVLAPHFNWLQSMLDDGLPIKSVTLQNVLSATHPSDDRWEDYSVQNRIADVVTYVELLDQRFPQIDVGIFDALPTHGRNWQSIYRALNEALGKYCGLDHIHLDLPGDFIGPNGNYKWSDVIEVQQFVQNQLDVEFGYNLTSWGGGHTSAQRWRTDSIFALDAYQNALRAAQIDEQPDRIIVMSWFPHPKASVPESTPLPSVNAPGGRVESLTALVRQSSNYLRGLNDWTENRIHDEVRQVFPVGASASSTLSPLFAAENAAMARGVTDGVELKDNVYWTPQPNDQDLWLKVDLPKAVNLDQVRLWPAPHMRDLHTNIFFSESGVGNPWSHPHEWSIGGSVGFRSIHGPYVDVDVSKLDGAPQFASSVLLSFDPIGDASVGLGAIRLYSPNTDWNQPYISPLAGYPHIDARLNDVFENTPGASVATLFADNRLANEFYSLSTDDNRFTFAGSILKLRSGVQLNRDEANAEAVWVMLTQRSDPTQTYPKLVAFSVVDTERGRPERNPRPRSLLAPPRATQ